MKELHRCGVVLLLIGVWLGCCGHPSPTQTPIVLPTDVVHRASPTESTGPSAPVLAGEYLGQPKPGLTLEPFAQGVFADDGCFGLHLHTSVYFSLDGQEVYFTHQALEPLQLTILFMRQEDGVWSQPQVAPFSGIYDDNCAAFSADGQRFYFTSNRPLSVGGEPEEESGIWFVERANPSWSEPRYIGSPTNLDRDEGTLYVGAVLGDSRGGYDVYRSRFVEGHYTALENLGEPINTELSEYVVLTASDESFLVYYRFHRAKKADAGLYVSSRLGTDVWSEPVYLDGKLGLDWGFDASLSPDGRYLFLLDRGVGVYWVDADVIE
jgi:hypothetical protein